jgi:hypothetical protein
MKDINELAKSDTYKKPIGIMELIKFHKSASKDQKAELQKHLNAGDHKKALDLVGTVTNTKLT